jgi:hypothetical protein
MTRKSKVNLGRPNKYSLATCGKQEFVGAADGSDWAEIFCGEDTGLLTILPNVSQPHQLSNNAAVAIAAPPYQT